MLLQKDQPTMSDHKLLCIDCLFIDLKFMNAKRNMWLWITSGTSKQGTCWGQYKFTCFVLCREVALFSDVVNYRKRTYLGPQAVFLVERSIIHCPYLGGFTIRGFIVLSIASGSWCNTQESFFLINNNWDDVVPWWPKDGYVPSKKKKN